MEKLEGFQSIITEQDLCDLLAIKRDTLDKLRLRERLPFVKLTDRARVYLEAEVLNWLRAHVQTIEK